MFQEEKVSDLCGSEWSSWLKHREFVIVWMYFPNNIINEEIKIPNTKFDESGMSCFVNCTMQHAQSY